VLVVVVGFEIESAKITGIDLDLSTTVSAE
jgi:hypothetical protein